MMGEAGGGEAGADVARPSALAEAVEARVGARAPRPAAWFTKVVAFYLRRFKERDEARTRAVAGDGQSISEAARRRILRASVKSAVSGAAAGTLSTAATLITAQTEGLAGLVAVPVAAVGIGAEMVFRSLVHLDLTVQLADLFGVELDAADPAEILRLYSLVFKTDGEEAEGGEGAAERDPSQLGKSLVHRVKHLDAGEVGAQIGDAVLGESVVRNIVPFVGIVSSAVTNFVLTQRLGNTVRRYMRYQRAIDDAFVRAEAECQRHLDLLVEGVWFIFTADGRLAPEETVTLVKLLEKLDPVTGRATLSRFVEDELDWADRIEQIPVPMRAAFYEALEVAACVDKEVSLPERKILRRAAHHLGLPFDLARLEAMVRAFGAEGVLAAA